MHAEEAAIEQLRANKGGYESKNIRRIDICESGRYRGWLSISIPRTGDYLSGKKQYDAARKIKGSHWHKEHHYIVTPITQCDSVIKFSEAFGYILTSFAKIEIAKYVLSRSTIESAPSK